MNLPRAVFSVLCVSGLLACNNNPPVTLRVITPDGGDPWKGPDAATHARVTLANDASVSQTVAVESGGGFRINVQPRTPQERVGVVVEALSGGVVVASGASPPVLWQLYAGHTLSVLMHKRDGLVESPSPLRTARADFELVPAGLLGSAAITVPTSTTLSLADVYDLTAHATTQLSKPVPGEFDGDTAVLAVAGGLVLSRASRTVFYADDQLSGVQEITQPATRPAVIRATAVTRPDGAVGWFVGGLSNGQPTTRVDRVFGNSTTGWAFASDDAASSALMIGRRAPSVIELSAATTNQTALWLVSEGQPQNQPAFELYADHDTQRSRLLSGLNAALDLETRTGAAVVCARWDSLGCTTVVVIGGSGSTGALAGEDVVLDGECLRLPAGRCEPVRAHGNWLTRRRKGARAAIAMNGRVLVSGGTDAQGAPVFDVEALDVQDPTMPRGVGVIGTLEVQDPAIQSLANGSVMLAGGLQANGTASNRVWFYRP